MPRAIEGFPVGIRNPQGRDDANPAVQLFGRRFITEQSPSELLSELLLVMVSEKSVSNLNTEKPLPALSTLKTPMLSSAFCYAPRARLNLKLFSFLGSSKLDTRHDSHRQHCKELWRALANRLVVSDSERDDVLRLLNSVFLGLFGVGSQRTWCAQGFLPVSRGLLSGEVLWNETEARRSLGSGTWNVVLDNFTQYFSLNKHRFMARGGEVLFLQICNAFSQDELLIQSWLEQKSGDGGASLASMLTSNEVKPDLLYNELVLGIDRFFEGTPKAFDELAKFIDEGVDTATCQVSDFNPDGSPRAVECGWCASESWREGYLFAIELKRLLSADIDVIEKIGLLEIACAMQVMRSLAAQSYRFTESEETDGFCHRVLVTDQEAPSVRFKYLSHESINNVCRSIFDAIRIPEIQDSIPSDSREDAYKEADSRYGQKLYLKLGKQIGLFVPRRGGRVRCVFNDRILRYLVLSLVPGARITLDSFKAMITAHHGLVFDENGLNADPDFKRKGMPLEASPKADEHLERMLDEAGVLVRLSDSCSLVRNPFYSEARS